MIAEGAESGWLGRLDRWAGSIVGRHFGLSLAVCIVGQSLIALGLTSPGVLRWSSVSRADLYHDVLLYFEYANRVFAGEVPYRDFLIEYPPMGLVVFLIPRWFASTFETYQVALALEMLAFNAATLVIAARWTAAREGTGKVPRVLAWYTAFFLLCNPTALARSDLAVMFVGFAACRLLLGGRPTAGGAMTAVAVLLKIFPGAVAAPAFFRELVEIRARRPRGIIAAGLVFAIGMGVWVAVGRVGVLRMFAYHADRGLELGSLYAGILMVVAKLRGEGLATVFNHYATHLESPTALRLAGASTWVQLSAMLLALWAYWRSGMRDGLRYATACLMAFVAFGKILSPQYLDWLIPFVACLEGRVGARVRVAFLVACGLTLMIYPWFFTWVAFFNGRGVLLLNARNLVLVAIYGLLVFDRRPPTDRG